MRALFLYGTLLDKRLLARLAGRATLRSARPAWIAGHRRVPLRGTPYPTLLRGAGAVRGLLVARLPPAAFGRLAAYEGASYRLVPVQVRTRRGPRWARAWVAVRWRADARRDWSLPARL